MPRNPALRIELFAELHDPTGKLKRPDSDIVPWLEDFNVVHAGVPEHDVCRSTNVHESRGKHGFTDGVLQEIATLLTYRLC
jgi:hypothetical protein